MTQAIAGLSNNDQYLDNKIVQINNLFMLYLDYKKDTENFDKFVKARAEEFEKKQRSKDKNKK
tara:strand:- start:590 stop:778 length:189 start_codon:yes stop_codon:yes gene_type:complete